ncbi:very short patch repair endonuclease [Stenotrophomonas sp. NRRL B-14846]|uniref:very short patch repair endonuclease n=1 Tax=Stenotrophomonas sp. NRRL B-14846 TaxID=3162882 RepID=UPI003D291920
MDIVDRRQRSIMMSGIKRTGTKPEMIVRKFLFSNGFRYRINVKDLPGAPDMVMKKHHLVIFVHGCFWHHHSGCKFAKMPKTRPEFWVKKLDGNVARDSVVQQNLLQLGWRIAVVWECALKCSPDDSLRELRGFVLSSRVYAQFSSF